MKKDCALLREGEGEHQKSVIGGDLIRRKTSRAPTSNTNKRIEKGHSSGVASVERGGTGKFVDQKPNCQQTTK